MPLTLKPKLKWLGRGGGTISMVIQRPQIVKHSSRKTNFKKSSKMWSKKMCNNLTKMLFRFSKKTVFHTWLTVHMIRSNSEHYSHWIPQSESVKTFHGICLVKWDKIKNQLLSMTKWISFLDSIKIYKLSNCFKIVQGK